MTVEEAIRARRSVKEFTAQSISRGAIQSLLDLAVLAPNHRMTEPWGFVVLGPDARRAYGCVRGEQKAASVDNPEVAEAVAAKVAREIVALPGLVAFTQRVDARPEIEEEDFASMYMAVQNFLLGAVALGMGTHVKTGSALDLPATRKALGVEEGERIVAMVHMGEPAAVGDPKARMPAADRTRWLP